MNKNRTKQKRKKHKRTNCIGKLRCRDDMSALHNGDSQRCEAGYMQCAGMDTIRKRNSDIKHTVSEPNAPVTHGATPREATLFLSEKLHTPKKIQCGLEARAYSFTLASHSLYCELS